LLFLNQRRHNQLLNTVVDEYFLLGHPLLDKLNDLGRLSITRHTLHVQGLECHVDCFDLDLVQFRDYLLATG